MSDKNRRIHSFVDVEIGGNSAGRIVLELFSDVCPKTCSNFISLCNGETLTNGAVGFKGSAFIALSNAVKVRCNCSSYVASEMLKERIYPGEVSVLKHFKDLLLSTAVRGDEADGLHWIITTTCAPELDNTHLVFGRVVSGQGVVSQIHNAMLKNGYAVKVTNCGELKSRTQDQRKPPTTYRSSVARYNSPDTSDSSSDRIYAETREKNLSNKLSRGATTSLMSSGERKIKGRGTVRYRASSSRSRSESETPPHWRAELDKAKPCRRDFEEDESRDRWIKGDKLTYYDSYDSRSERSRGRSDGSDDDYRRRSRSSRRHKEYRSQRDEESRSRSRERSISYSRRYTDERSRYSSERSRVSEEVRLDRRRHDSKRSQSTKYHHRSETDFSASEFESYHENLKKSERKLSHCSPTTGRDSSKNSEEKSRKKGKSLKKKRKKKKKKHSRENRQKSSKLEVQIDDSIKTMKDRNMKLDKRRLQSPCSLSADSASVVSSSVSSASSVSRGKSLRNTQINLLKKKSTSQNVISSALSSDGESQERSMQLKKSFEKSECLYDAKTQISHPAYDEELFISDSRSVRSSSVEDEYKIGLNLSDVVKGKNSRYLEINSSLKTEQLQELALSPGSLVTSKCSSSDKDLMGKKFFQKRPKNSEIGLSSLWSDSQSQHRAKDPETYSNSDFLIRMNEKAVDAKSWSKCSMEEIPSSDEEKTKYEFPAKRVKYDSDFDDDERATSSSTKKLRSSKAEKNDHLMRDKGFMEQDEIVAYSTVSEKMHNLRKEKPQVGCRIESMQNTDGKENVHLSLRGRIQKDADDNILSKDRKLEKQNSASESVSKKKLRIESQQQSKTDPTSLEMKYRQSESQSLDSDAYAHSELSWTYFKRSQNRSLSGSSHSSDRQSISPHRRQHGRTSRCCRSYSYESSRTSLRSEHRSGSQSSRSICRSRSNSSRSLSSRSSRSRRRSLTSNSFSSSCSLNSRSKRETGRQRKVQRQSPNSFNNSALSKARISTMESMPSFVISTATSIQTADSDRNAAIPSLSDSPPPSRWKPGQKPWQPKKVFQMSSSIKPVVEVERRESKSESINSNSQIVTKDKGKDKKTSEEDQCSREKRLHYLSKQSYRKGSHTSSSSSERENMGSSCGRRRQDRHARQDTMHSTSSASSSRSRSSSDEEKNRSGSSELSERQGSRSQSEMKMKRRRGWGGSNTSDRLSRSTDRSSKLESLSEYFHKNRHKEKMKTESDSRKECTKVIDQKSESNKKQKTRVSQKFQWQPPVEPEYMSSSEDEDSQLGDLSRLSIRRDRKRKNIKDVAEFESSCSKTAKTEEEIEVLGGANKVCNSIENAEPKDPMQAPEQNDPEKTEFTKIDEERNKCTVTSAAIAGGGGDHDDDAVLVTEEGKRQCLGIIKEFSVDDAVHSDVVDVGALTQEDSLPLPGIGKFKFEKMETEDKREDLEAKNMIEPKAEPLEQKISDKKPDSELSDVVSNFFVTSSIKQNREFSDAKKMETDKLKDCVQAQNRVSLPVMKPEDDGSTVPPIADSEQTSTNAAAAASKSNNLSRHLQLNSSHSGPSKLSKPNTNDNRLLGNKQLNFMWKSRSRISGSNSVSVGKLDSPGSPRVLTNLYSPEKLGDSNKALPATAALGSSKKLADQHTKQSSLLLLKQNIESEKSKITDGESEYKSQKNSITHQRKNSASSRDLSSRSSSHDSRIYIISSTSSEDEDNKHSRSFRSRSQSLRKYKSRSRSPTDSRGRSYRHWQSRSRSSSYEQTRAGRHASGSTKSRSTSRSNTRQRNKEETNRRRRRRRSDSRSFTRSHSRRRRVRSRSRSRLYASVERSRTRSWSSESRTRSRPKHRHRYSSRDSYDSYSDDSRSSSSRHYRRHSKQSDTSSSAASSYTRKRSSRRSYHWSSSSSSSD